MRGRGTKEIRGELRELILEQTEALRAQTFGGLTEAECEEYDRRQKQIHELCQKLSRAMEEEAEETKQAEKSEGELKIRTILRRPA